MTNKTLEELENDVWLNANEKNPLLRRIMELRKMPLDKFSIEDLRLMIGQQMSLEHLMPLALEALEKDLFVEGALFEGDLLKNVLEVDTKYWNAHKEQWQKLHELIQPEILKIKGKKFDMSRFKLRN